MESAIAMLLPLVGGAGLLMQPCAEVSLPQNHRTAVHPQLLQQFKFKGDGTMMVQGAPTSCVTYGGDGVPLSLSKCNSSDSNQQWVWAPAMDHGTGAVRLSDSNPAVCFNVRTLPGSGYDPGAVGTYRYTARTAAERPGTSFLGIIN